ncbi:Mu transposase C-terminal domain-containing protein [Poseidonocella sp. HB161398]|uniref:Mu transposase C-terminal domain-containing protein n=1 Tax=Poseidonocella sp. HB161398 TaxID=2320855 RepID=UPI0011083FE5|nr:Mu transposase C-terminal domain-containing protein [Poseidonocella sp. HB161398]
MIDLLLGQVFLHSETEHRERLIWLLPRRSGGWFIDIDDPKAVPICRARSELGELTAAGTVAVVDDPWIGQGEALTDSRATRRDEAFSLLKPLLAQQPDIFDPRKRAPAVNSHAAETGTTRQKIYRLLRRWWQRGMTPAALCPDYAASGAPGRPKPDRGIKRGAPVLYGGTGMNVDETVRTAFRKSVNEHLATKKSKNGSNGKIDIATCYDLCLKHHFTDLVFDEASGRQKKKLREEHPSLAQFRYWLEQDNDLFELARKRRTPRVYDKDSRAILGTSLDEVNGPGSRYQIDATIADIYLVSRFDRRKIVGRPTIYVVIDVFSRMIAGVYIGLENASWVGAMTALANAACAKPAWCAQFGIEIGEADWPCHSLPAVLLADRGEMLGPAANTLIQRFGMRLENAAPYRADWKGIVERRFGLLHAAFGPFTPGFVAPDFRERGARDYRLDATLDIDDFTKIIINIVLYYNNQHMLGGYERDPQMIADHVDPVPLDLWSWGIQRRTGLQRSFPEDLVKLALLPSGEASVTAKGLRFNRLYYSCPRAIAEHWFEKARQTRSWKVPISYEPRLMDTIWIRDPNGRGPFEPCSLTVRSDPFRGRTLWEIDQIQKEDRRQRAERLPAQTQGRIDFMSSIDEIVDNAKARKPEDRRSKAERTRDIRGSRTEERAALRPREAFDLAPNKGGSADVLPFDRNQDRPSDDYDLPPMENIRKHLDKSDGEDGDA